MFGLLLLLTLKFPNINIILPLVQLFKKAEKRRAVLFIDLNAQFIYR